MIGKRAEETYRIIIGLDIGTHTGLAVYDSVTGLLIDCRTMDITSALEEVLSLTEIGPILVRMEDVKSWKPFKGQPRDYKRLAGAGSIKRDQSIWQAFLQRKGIEFELVGLTDCRKKMDKKLFKEITGWDGLTNEHNRDAGMLCYGVTRYLKDK